MYFLFLSNLASYDLFPLLCGKDAPHYPHSLAGSETVDSLDMLVRGLHVFV